MMGIIDAADACHRRHMAEALQQEGPGIPKNQKSVPVVVSHPQAAAGLAMLATKIVRPVEPGIPLFVLV